MMSGVIGISVYQEGRKGEEKKREEKKKLY